MTVAVCRVEAAVIKVGEGHPPTTEGIGEVEMSLDGPPLPLPWTLPKPNELPGVVMKGSAKRQNAAVEHTCSKSVVRGKKGKIYCLPQILNDEC